MERRRGTLFSRRGRGREGRTVVLRVEGQEKKSRGDGSAFTAGKSKERKNLYSG